MASYYLLRDGSTTKSLEQVKKLRADKEYSILRQYLNDRTKVVVEWFGGPFPDSTPVQHAMPFRVQVWIIVPVDPEGVPYDPPKEVPDKTSGGWYRHEREAIDYYENFLVLEGTGSEWMKDQNGDPRFVERGNRLAPPSKDVPQAPPEEESTPETLAAVGSW